MALKWGEKRLGGWKTTGGWEKMDTYESPYSCFYSFISR